MSSTSLRQRRHGTRVQTTETSRHDMIDASSPLQVAALPFKSASVTSCTSSGGLLLFCAMASVRLLYAMSMPIQDCDESFNYWEPVHYLLHGHGFQTWEYSPVYALRSYLYLCLHAFFIQLANVTSLSQACAYGAALVLQLTSPLSGSAASSLATVPSASAILSVSSKEAEFYALRTGLGLLSAYCETRFVFAIARHCRFAVAALTAVLLISSAGMSHAAIAFLPSSFSMCFLMLSCSAWMETDDEAAAAGHERHDERKTSHRAPVFDTCILCTAISVLIGWPFAALFAFPLALTIICVSIAPLRPRLLLRPVLVGLLSSILCLLPSLLIDRHFYKRWLIAIVHLALYNSAHGDNESGANLYGVEPPSFYVLNLFLNLNLIFVVALLAPILITLFYLVDGTRLHLRVLLWSSGAYLWLLAMFAMPHKEERFLFLAYPMLCFVAAYTAVHLIVVIRHWFCCATGKRRSFKDDEDDEISALHEAQERRNHDQSAHARQTTNARLLSAQRLHQSLAAPLGAFAILALSAFAIASVALSLSRVAALILHYNAPLHVYHALSNPAAFLPQIQHTIEQSSNVCVSKEWYRFPSHFFLPDHMRLRYVQSSFTGLLPRLFSEVEEAEQVLVARHKDVSQSLFGLLQVSTRATSIIPPFQNANNRQELERYIPLAECELFIDLELETQLEPLVSQLIVHSPVKGDGSAGNATDECVRRSTWTPLYRHPFLWAEQSPVWTRAFYVPILSAQRNTFASYMLLLRNDTLEC